MVDYRTTGLASTIAARSGITVAALYARRAPSHRRRTRVACSAFHTAS